MQQPHCVQCGLSTTQEQRAPCRGHTVHSSAQKAVACRTEACLKRGRLLGRMHMACTYVLRTSTRPAQAQHRLPGGTHASKLAHTDS